MISLRRKKKGLKAKGRKILVGPDLSNVVSTNKDFTRLFYGALHYAQYDVADKQLKKEMLKYAKAQKLDHKLLGLLSDKDFQTVGKLALIGFADNGPGIDEANHERVFEKFARLSAASLAGSAGLGLPISREIMRNLKGDLTLQANAPGAVFRVSLPLSTA